MVEMIFFSYKITTFYKYKNELKLLNHIFTIKSLNNKSRNM